jgi:hypothetical protein
MCLWRHFAITHEWRVLVRQEGCVLLEQHPHNSQSNDFPMANLFHLCYCPKKNLCCFLVFHNPIQRTQNKFWYKTHQFALHIYTSFCFISDHSRIALQSWLLPFCTRVGKNAPFLDVRVKFSYCVLLLKWCTGGLYNNTEPFFPYTRFTNRSFQCTCAVPCVVQTVCLSII